jgi:hypothetical protein
MSVPLYKNILLGAKCTYKRYIFDACFAEFHFCSRELPSAASQGVNKLLPETHRAVKKRSSHVSAQKRSRAGKTIDYVRKFAFL